MTAFLVGRHPLAPTLLGSLLGSVAALGPGGRLATAGVALAVFVVVGLTLAVFNATSKTLMQRAVPADAIAGSFAVVESLMNLGLAVGSVLIWVGVRAVGPRASLLAPAVATVLVVAAVAAARTRRRAGRDPQVEIRLLRSMRIFAPLLGADPGDGGPRARA